MIMPLTKILKPQHRQTGLYLEEDEDFLYLKCIGVSKTLATFSTRGATIESIWEEADKWTLKSQ